MGRYIAPSLLAADFANLRQAIEMVNQSDADLLHLDIMDGQYVPNLSFGIPIVKTAKKISTKPLDVHLMIVQPERYFSQFRDAGANHLTIHIEACNHLHRAIEEIHELGMKAGVALNPHTPVSFLEEIIPFVDQVLIMSVNPGFGGQKFIETSYDKIRKMRSLIEQEHSSSLIEVDGGVDLQNAGKLFEAGVNILVAGTTIFHDPDPKAIIRAMKKA